MQTLNVSVVSELGRGTSGIVYKVQHNSTGLFYVVKQIDLSQTSAKRQSQAIKEVEILKQVSHPHIIQYYNSVIQDDILYILMEFAAGGDLQQKVNRYKQSQRKIEEGQIWAWTFELTLAVKYLHRHKILHRDIKLMNIFLDKDSRVKLGDLGLSKIIHKQEICSETLGTPLYLSPEQIRHQPYGFKVDIWGIGCAIYTLCALEAPFMGDSLLTLGQNIAMKCPKPLPTKYTPKLLSFVQQLLEKIPKSRPSANEIIEEIPSFIKKMYRKPMGQEIVEKKRESSILKSFEETSSTEVVFPRFASQNFDRDVDVSMKIREIKDAETRPPTQATKRLLIAGADTGRISTAYVRQRFVRAVKQKTTISDLFNIL